MSSAQESLAFEGSINSALSENPPSYKIDLGGRTIDAAHQLPNESEILSYAASDVKLAICDVDSTLTHGHEGSILPGAYSMIERAREAGMQVAVVSNNPDRLYVAGVAKRLAVPTELTFSPQSLVECKPSPLMLNHAIEQAGVSSEEVLAIGDGVTDVVAGLAAGVRRYRLVLTQPQEVGGYPLRSEVRAIVHGLGRAALPHLIKSGFAKRVRGD